MLRGALWLLRLELVPILGRLPAYARLALALLREPALPSRHKALLVVGVCYLLSPVDLIPALVPVLGQLDDLAVALIALRLTLRAMPPEVAERHLTAHALSWARLDADLARVGRSGRLVVRAGLWAGERLARGAWRLLCRSGTALLDRSAARHLTA
ncbi:MAG: YkvA family protein [Armatimonadota bacterium]|nr:YkvA family protein [Armatimonadota bacterium]MDR7423506.1 YkvA family protein [Armatimonadota bacterium]MDR7456812.1 YkvA family protein [Armatimonadota bacterium]